jgi:hypothetical protein
VFGRGDSPMGLSQWMSHTHERTHTPCGDKLAQGEGKFPGSERRPRPQGLREPGSRIQRATSDPQDGRVA